MSRLGIPWNSDIPLCVQQWQGLIAVNYPARKFGITRHESPASALEKCPHLTLVHCATYGPGDKEPNYDHENPQPGTHKVSLAPRRACRMWPQQDIRPRRAAASLRVDATLTPPFLRPPRSRSTTIARSPSRSCPCSKSTRTLSRRPRLTSPSWTSPSACGPSCSSATRPWPPCRQTPHQTASSLSLLRLVSRRLTGRR